MSDKATAGRGRLLSGLLATVALAAALMTAPTANAMPTAGAAAAPKLLSNEVFGDASVVSTTHKQLAISVQAFLDSARGGEPASSTLDVTPATRSGSESHEFGFIVGASTLHFSDGKGYIRPANSTLPDHGRMDLAIVVRGTTRRVNCSTATNYTLSTPVTLRGRFFFETRSTGRNAWGSIGSTSRVFSMRATMVRTYTTNNGSGGGCGTPLPACTTGPTWDVFHGTSSVQLFADSTLAPKSELFADRSVTISKTLSRFDSVLVAVPRPRLSGEGANARLSITTTAGSRASGSAVLNATAASSARTSACKLGTSRRIETIRSFPATLTSHRLAVRELVFGTLSYTAGSGDIDNNSHS